MAYATARERKDPASSDEGRLADHPTMLCTAPRDTPVSAAIWRMVLPSLRSLYDDRQILQSVPVIALGREAITNIRTRPISPFYMQIAPRIARAFNRTLRGDVTGAQAVEALQQELQTILRRNR